MGIKIETGKIKVVDLAAPDVAGQAEQALDDATEMLREIEESVSRWKDQNKAIAFAWCIAKTGSGPTIGIGSGQMMCWTAKDDTDAASAKTGFDEGRESFRKFSKSMTDIRYYNFVMSLVSQQNETFFRLKDSTEFDDAITLMCSSVGLCLFTLNSPRK